MLRNKYKAVVSYASKTFELQINKQGKRALLGSSKCTEKPPLKVFKFNISKKKQTATAPSLKHEFN
jgi:hypothetical protein